MIPRNHLIIAIDFDGTIVEDAFPRIGKPLIFAFDTLKKKCNQKATDSSYGPIGLENH